MSRLPNEYIHDRSSSKLMDEWLYSSWVIFLSARPVIVPACVKTIKIFFVFSSVIFPFPFADFSIASPQNRISFAQFFVVLRGDVIFIISHSSHKKQTFCVIISKISQFNFPVNITTPPATSQGDVLLNVFNFCLKRFSALDPYIFKVSLTCGD